MANLVLYRKYRPRIFAEVVGQEHIIQTITNAVSSDLISHAYLFTGPRGSGKTSVARILAKAVNCEDRDGFEPCNKCSSCLEIIAGSAMDLIEIDAASHRGIDEIRELREGVRFAPSKLKYKVFIIDECHQLTKEASNALLKTLEEPPSRVIFILATTEIQKMLPTILSRCQRFDFRKLTAEEIINRLDFICEKEGIKIEKPALELIALHSEGALRDAQGFLDQALTFAGGGKKEIRAEEIKDLLGLVETNLVSQFFQFICEKKPADAIEFLNKTIDKGIDAQEFAKAFNNYLRQAIILKVSGGGDTNKELIVGLTKEEFENLQNQIAGIEQSELQRIINLFIDAENKVKFASIPQLPLELALIESCGKPS
ncbi:DNA polymerase III subunit gamma/tau [Candidatus Parcubacteria bacterium]|nr:DNA polymerase III subunit gamma/tau [Candidatus Parcubacteria bacterium]